MWKNLGSGTNGIINTIAIDSNNNVYVGGLLTLAMWDPNTQVWSSLGNCVGLHDCVSIVLDSSNNVYLGGYFEMSKYYLYTDVAVWDSTNKSWSYYNLKNKINECKSIAIDSNNNIYVGGIFTQNEGIVKLNPIDKSLSYLGFGLKLCNALAVDSNNNIYALGVHVVSINIDLEQYNSQLVVYNVTTQNYNVIELSNNDSNTYYSIAIDSNNNVYVGGTFSTIGDINANNIAMWNPTTQSWSSLNEGLSTPPYSSTCNSIAIDSNDNVYAGGQFSRAGNLSVNNIAMWNPTTQIWSSLKEGLPKPPLLENNNLVDSPSESGFPVFPLCYSIICNQNNVYVGGQFSKAGNVSCNNIASYSYMKI